MNTLQTMARAVMLVCAVAMLFVSATGAQATEVWSGRTFLFLKANWADWTLAPNQDHITDLVRITRADSHGIFNIAQESAYTIPVSPVDTEWATGNAADWATLTFTAWEVWHGLNPPSTVGVDAVVHLVTDDIYIDIRFTSWTQSAMGGGFSYYRAVDPSAVEASSWAAIKALYR